MKTETTQTIKRDAEAVAAMIEPKPIGKVNQGNRVDGSDCYTAMWHHITCGIWELRYSPTDPRFLKEVRNWIWDQGWEYIVQLDYDHGDRSHPMVTASVFDGEDISKVFTVDALDDLATAEATALLRCCVEAFL